MKRLFFSFILIMLICLGFINHPIQAAENQSEIQKSNATTTQQINTSSQDSTPRAHIEQQLSKDDTTTSLPEDKTNHTSSNNNNDNSQNISLHKEERAKHQNKVDDTNTQSNGNNRNDLVNKNATNTTSYHLNTQHEQPNSNTKEPVVNINKNSNTPKQQLKEQQSSTKNQSNNDKNHQQQADQNKQLYVTSTQTQEKAKNNDSSKTKSTNKNEHKILHTNDIHGRFVEDDGKVIGMPKVKGLKDKENPDLLLDSGDAFQGLPVSNNSKGEEMAKAMNSAGYDAMTLGNHEFDFGYDQLLKLKKQLNFPMITSNVYKNGKSDFEPSTIINKNGIRYGIVGVTTPETKTKTSPSAVKGVEFKDPLTSVKRAMNDIKDQVDVFVILSHLGVDPNTKKEWRGDYLTEQLSKDKSFKQSIIVLDGHSHTVIKNGKSYDKNVLGQTGTALENVGRIRFNREDNQTKNLKADLINVADTKNIQPDTKIEKQVNKANDDFLKATSTVIIPNNKVKLNGERNVARTQETNLGNLITDAMEDYASKKFSHRPDFAITNGGGIRASIDKGKVTQNDIITVLPFGNLISQIKVKGSDVKKAFEHSLSAPTESKNGKPQLTANGGFLQVSKSIRIGFDMDKKSDDRVTDIQIINHDTGKFEKLDPNKTYYVATNDFTANKGDGYDMFGGKREEGVSLDEVVAQYIKDADLSKYDTNKPERIINGQLPQNNKHSDKVVPLPKTNDSKSTYYPGNNVVAISPHQRNHSGKPSNRTVSHIDAYQPSPSNKISTATQNNTHHHDKSLNKKRSETSNQSDDLIKTNIFNTKSTYLRNATSYSQSNLDIVTSNTKHIQNMYNGERSQQSTHDNLAILPNTGGSNHSDVIALLVAITGITLLYSRKKSA
ncbi:5'-nucleotidase C-terminal domain-containing protein [Staphylococcaceae bacterium DP2N0-1]|nr:5'-nucleotidase C-terminal domain-containing protein [Staphylococcaceae bacterium DP2N0-1]